MRIQFPHLYQGTGVDKSSIRGIRALAFQYLTTTTWVVPLRRFLELLEFEVIPSSLIFSFFNQQGQIEWKLERLFRFFYYFHSNFYVEVRKVKEVKPNEL